MLSKGRKHQLNEKDNYSAFLQKCHPEGVLD